MHDQCLYAVSPFLYTAPCNVEVSVALVHTRAAIKSPSVCQHIQQSLPDLGTEADMSSLGDDFASLTGEDSLDHGTISLCDPISVCIHPLPENAKV